MFYVWLWDQNLFTSQKPLRIKRWCSMESHAVSQVPAIHPPPPPNQQILIHLFIERWILRKWCHAHPTSSKRLKFSVMYFFFFFKLNIYYYCTCCSVFPVFFLSEKTDTFSHYSRHTTDFHLRIHCGAEFQWKLRTWGKKTLKRRRDLLTSSMTLTPRSRR